MDRYIFYCMARKAKTVCKERSIDETQNWQMNLKLVSESFLNPQSGPPWGPVSFLPWEPHEQYEKAKIYYTEHWKMNSTDR